jgi:hypothetical protein
MSIFLRRATSLLLLAAIGTVAILGENLHLLCGKPYGQCVVHVLAAHDCTHGHHGHDEALADKAATFTPSHDNCPVCEFLAQFRLVGTSAHAVIAVAWTGPVSPAKASMPAIQRPWRDWARGPPAYFLFVG